MFGLRYGGRRKSHRAIARVQRGRASSLHWPCYDGLRRAAALPRALREPLPARAAGEVQGLRARARVVARLPARADGGLPAHLLRALAPERDRPLSALPAHGARALGLLLERRRALRALADRLRRADQEGALPGPARAALGGRDAARHVRGDARRRRRPEPRAA